MTGILIVALGGAFGAVLRYILVTGVQSAYPSSFPLGTLFVNLVGCFCIGLLAAKLLSPEGFKDEYRLLLQIGLLGSLTTFSAFAWEGVWLLRDGRISLALSYVLLSNVLGLALAWGGFLTAGGMKA
jgi:CrcB protein